jgi:hypothetical protein
MTMRPTMGLLLVWWAIRGQWRALAWALGGGAVLVLLSLPLIGPGPYLDFITVLRNLSHVTGVPNNVDPATIAWRLGLPPALVGLALPATYLTALAACLLSLRRDREVSFVVVAMATLFVSPLLWDHYLTQLLVPAALLAKRGHRWGLLLPILGWAPAVGLKLALPLVGLLGLLAPFVVRDTGEPALAGGRLGRRGLGGGPLEADDVAGLDGARLERAGG